MVPYAYVNHFCCYNKKVWDWLIYKYEKFIAAKSGDWKFKINVSIDLGPGKGLTFEFKMATS